MFLDIYRGHLFFAYSFQLAPPIIHVTQIEVKFTSSNKFGIIFWPISIVKIDNYGYIIFLLYKFIQHNDYGHLSFFIRMCLAPIICSLDAIFSTKARRILVS